MMIRLRLLRVLAALLLLYETILECFWPLLLWACAFICIWLLQIPQMFHLAVEVVVSAAFIAGAVVLTAQGVRAVRLPGRNAITRRIEIDSNLNHRPLSGLADTLANPGDSRTQTLWTLWQSRLAPALKALKYPRPRPVLTRRDPYALRGLAFVALIAAIVMAGPGWAGRVRHGLIPILPDFIENPADKVVIWITPPDYTAQKQIILNGRGDSGKITTIPDGSTIKARVTGWIGTPTLSFGDVYRPLEKLGSSSYGIETLVHPATTMTIRQTMLTRAEWPITVLPDAPPTVVQKAAPEMQNKGSIKFPITVRDDYSVESMTVHMALAPGITAPPLGAAIDITRSVMSPGQTDMDLTPEFDLAWHPWAGLNVVVDITVRDHKGQIASLTGIPVTLPERHFAHPTAKNLIDMRKRLIQTPAAQAPAAAQSIGQEIEQIMIRPGMYHGDPVVFLSLRSMASRLFLSEGHSETIAHVVEHLWDTALRIEDGNLSLAHRDFMEAQTALQEALKNPDSTPADLAQKMQEMRQAMAAYLNEMFREMQKRMADSPAGQKMISPEMIMQNINPQDLAAFLDKMQAEALSGNRESAREMLSQMERFMNMMDPASMDMDMPQDMQAMMETLDNLQNIIQKQQDLLEETQRQSQGDGQRQNYAAPLAPDTGLLQQWGLDNLPPPPQETRSGDNAPRREVDTAATGAEQEDLRRQLGDTMREANEKIGQIPDNMGKADQAMTESAAALGANNPAMSIPQQEAAIKHLSDGQQQMAKQLGQRMQQMMMFSFGMGQTDPLGRPMGDGDNGSPWAGSKVKIPDQAERRRVQDILDELRKKSGELTRPDYELDYYRRLMRQF